MPACCDGDNVRHKNRTPEQIKALTTRLNRIEGQICGIKKMIEDNRYMLFSAGEDG